MIEKLPQTFFFLSNMELPCLNYRNDHYGVFSLKVLLDVAAFRIITALQARKRDIRLRLDMMRVNGWMWPVGGRACPDIVGC